MSEIKLKIRNTGARMKKGIRHIFIYITFIIGILCMICNLFLKNIDALIGYALENLSIAFIGLFISICGLVYGACKRYGKRDWKLLLIGLFIGCFLLFIGGKNLVSVGLDKVQGTTTERITSCTVSNTVSLKRLFSSYYLEGTTELGKEKSLRIDRATYYNYKDEYGFQVFVSYWEHSGVVKEIISE